MAPAHFNFLSLHEAIDLLGISRSTFDRWRKQKQLPFTKIGKEIWVDRDELERWFRHHSYRLEPSPGGLSEASEPASDRRPLTITVGYQSRTAQVWTASIMKELGWFEEELAALMPNTPVAVRWLDSASGPALVQEMIGGHIQIASLGDYPISLGFSLRRMLPAFRPVLAALDGRTGGGIGISLVLRNGLELRHRSALAEHAVSVVAQSSADIRLPDLLGKLDVQPAWVVHKEQQASWDSLAARRIAGSVLGEPYLSLVRHYGLGQVIREEGLGDDYLTGVIVEESWAERHPAAAVAYMKAHLRVHRLLREDPAKAAGLAARAADVPAGIARDIIASVRWDSLLYAKDVGALRSMGRSDGSERSPLGGLAMPEDRGIRYDLSYLNQAIRALKLPVPGDRPVEEGWAGEPLY